MKGMDASGKMRRQTSENSLYLSRPERKDSVLIVKIEVGLSGVDKMIMTLGNHKRMNRRQSNAD